MKVLKYILTAFVIILTGAVATAQTKEAKKATALAEIKALVESRNFNFVAQYVTPQGGMRRYLTSSYDMSVKKDSLITYLPYFGQAYFDSPYNPTDGGIKFTSTDFSYKVTAKKKSGWEILLQPKDVRYYNQITLNISPEGYTNVYFNITNKSTINFDGYIQKNEAKK